MANRCELLINVVSANKPKVLISPGRTYRLEPKGEGSGKGAPNSPIANDVPPAERQSLIHTFGTCTERSKHVGLPEEALSIRESEPQGTLMTLRVWDGGKSECFFVMKEIGVEPLGDITPRESGLTSYPGRSSRENLANYPHEGKQMTAGIVPAGAPSSQVIGTVAPSVYREVVTGAYLSQRVLPKGLAAA